MECGFSKSSICECWRLGAHRPKEFLSSTWIGQLEVNRSGPTGIVGVLHNSKGEDLLSFLNPIRIKDSNEALVLATLEALRLYEFLL